MSVINKPALSHSYICSVGRLLLVFSAVSLFGQVDALQLANPGPQGQTYISTNQLRAPRKALQAADRARADILCGRLEAAQKELTHALDLAPHYAVAIAMQGAVNLQAGNIGGAEEAFKRALKEDPTLGAAYVGAAVVLIAEDRFKDALIPLNRATSLLPNSWYVHLETGLAHLGIGNTDAALLDAELAERFAGRDPERQSGSAYLRAMVYTAMKDSDKARKCFTETINRDPNGFYAALVKKNVVGFRAAVTGTD